MVRWGELLSELKSIRASGQPVPFDQVRRKYLGILAAHTGRNVILYATKWTHSSPPPPDLTAINEEDLQGFIEVTRTLPGDALDLILHSPGGSAEAVEPIVKHLRSKFSDIRVIIPHAAMSAATMLACSADRISMASHSSIGPIDPQFIFRTQLGIQSVPAKTIIDQFRMAQRECANPQLLGSWAPILPQYGPALLVQSEHAIELAKELVSEWLATYMFRGSPSATKKALESAKQLADFPSFRSHRRHIDRGFARAMGLQVEDMEADAKFYTAVLDVYNITTITFDGTAAVKIIENHLHHAFVKTYMVAEVFPQRQPTPQAPAPPTPSPPSPPIVP